MEADAPQWNAEDGQEEGKKRRRSGKGKRNGKKTRGDQMVVASGELPPSIVDTGSMMKEGHPALNAYLRGQLAMKIGGTQWHEAGFEEYQQEEMQRLQAHMVGDHITDEITDQDQQLDSLRNSFIQNRSNYEAIKEQARKKCEEEGVDWAPLDQYAKTLN